MSKAIVRDIFISHAVADEALVEKFIELLQTGLDIPSKRIFCSSSPGLGPKKGEDFLVGIKEHIQNSTLVLSLLSKNYYASEFCLCELGATWALSHDHLPIVVPPLSFSDVKGVLKVTEATDITLDTDLDEFRDAACTILNLGDINTALWNNRKKIFLRAIKRIIKKLPEPQKISLKEHQELTKELSDSQAYIEQLSSDNDQLTRQVEALEKLKDAEQVTEAKKEFRDSSEQDKFDDLLEEVGESLQPFSSIVSEIIISEFFNLAYTPKIQEYQEDLEDADRRGYIDIEDFSVRSRSIKVSNFQNNLRKLQSEMRAGFSEGFKEEYIDEYKEEFSPSYSDFWERHFGLF